MSIDSIALCRLERIKLQIEILLGVGDAGIADSHESILARFSVVDKYTR